jgi:phosphatidylserine decarboxylase
VILAIGIGAVLVGFDIIGIAVIILGAAVAAFFRDPERLSFAAAGAVLSAADGRVCGIRPATLPENASEGPYTRISVFMSPLDVHVNRAPVSGEVTCLAHTSGQFRAAFRDVASERNERNFIKIKGGVGREYAVVQIAGYLARRIVCKLRPNQRLERGQRIGLIMFGSRVDHLMPRDYRVLVQIGEKVRAGETVIGEPPQ